MSEELLMDKNKNLRAANPTAKSVTEKTHKDASRFNKNQKYRNSHQNKQDGGYSKKPPHLHRNNGFDRHPRTRGKYAEFCETNKNQEVTPKNEAEVESALNHGSKKTNLNHLLNFTYSSQRDVSSGYIGLERAWRHPKKKTFNKEQFLQANCKFVVKNSADYQIHLADPDALVAWENVEEILITCTEEPSCPICLYPPQAAKMTKCGHVYCWPCILHYLALSDKVWRKCPICYEPIYKDGLKSVSTLFVPSYKVNDEISMRLMFKERGSVQVFPLSKKDEHNLIPPSYVQGDFAFAKLISSCAKDVSLILEREETELNKVLEIEKDTPEVCFIQEALQLLNNRRKQTRSSFDVEDCQDQFKLEINEPVLSTDTSNAHKVAYTNAFVEEEKNANFLGDESLIECNEMIADEDDGCLKSFDNLHIDSAAKNTNHPKDRYLFYQASDGQPIYLHALNVKMLVKEFGSLETCPESITAKIVQLERNTMDENMRRRLRYLNHLPLQCEFVVAELIFDEQHLPKETLQEFKQEVDKRRHLRQRRARDERNREKIIKTEEDKKKGVYPTLGINVDSFSHFPSCGADSATAGHPFEDIPVASSPNSDVGSSELSASSFGSNVTDPSSHASFAEMLRAGKKKSNATKEQKWSSIHTLENDEAGEGIIAPNYNQSFSDAIQAAFDVLEEDRPTQGKKKKGKKKLLFSTNMNRAK